MIEMFVRRRWQQQQRSDKLSTVGGDGHAKRVYVSSIGSNRCALVTAMLRFLISVRIIMTDKNIPIYNDVTSRTRYEKWVKCNDF
jgi:hypothetical protein